MMTPPNYPTSDGRSTPLGGVEDAETSIQRCIDNDGTGAALPDGFKLDVPHGEGCRTQHDKDGLVFVVTDRERPILWNRCRNGYNGGSTMWWQFVCNDPACPAKMLVRWDTMSAFVSRAQP